MAATESSARDAEIKRLRDELKQTQLRLEEVTSYYRGELEAVRKRAEDELLQVQADEAARRRRAEEQVTQLNADLKSARSEADKAKRRYQELLKSIEALEAETQAEVRAERDRHEDSARAAWQTAEEEVERLNGEMAEIQRELEAERSERQRAEQAKADLEAAYQRRDDERQRLIDRLKRALKASESRREALETEAQQRPAAAAPAATQRASRAASGGVASAESRVEVDPSAGWGHFQLGEGDDIAEEFLMIDADRSFNASQASGADSGNDEAKPASGPASAGDSADRARPAQPGSQAEVADDEAERLIMGVAVDRQVAQRQAEGTGETNQPSGQPAAGARPRSRQPPVPDAEPPWWRRHRWLLLTVVLAAGAAAGFFWLTR